MSRKKQKKRGISKRASATPSPKERRDPITPFSLSDFWRSKTPIVLYGVKFITLISLFYILLLLPSLGHLLDRLSNVLAFVASFLLNLFGEKCHAAEGIIYSPHFAITVAPVCTGAEFLCFFASAVLVFPAPWIKKVIGILTGMGLLSGLNLLRIVSLYATGVHFPSIFDALHEQVWGFIIIPATLLLFMGWMKWALAANEVSI